MSKSENVVCCCCELLSESRRIWSQNGESSIKEKFMEKLTKPIETKFSYQCQLQDQFYGMKIKEFEICYTLNLIIGKYGKKLKFLNMKTRKLIRKFKFVEFFEFLIEERKNGICNLFISNDDQSVCCYSLDRVLLSESNELINPVWEVKKVGRIVDVSNMNSFLFVVNSDKKMLSILNSANGQVISTLIYDFPLEIADFKFNYEFSCLCVSDNNLGIVHILKFNEDFSKIIEKKQIESDDFISCLTFDDSNMIILGPSSLSVFQMTENNVELIKEYLVYGSHLRIDKRNGHLLLCGGNSKYIKVYN